MFFDMTTDEMMDYINKRIFQKSEDECYIPVRENQIILISVLVNSYNDEVKIEIEWMECEPYKSLECSVVNYFDKKELRYAVDYIRSCAEY